jgi:hypothetical protein
MSYETNRFEFHENSDSKHTYVYSNNNILYTSAMIIELLKYLTSCRLRLSSHFTIFTFLNSQVHSIIEFHYEEILVLFYYCYCFNIHLTPSVKMANKSVWAWNAQSRYYFFPKSS